MVVVGPKAMFESIAWAGGANATFDARVAAAKAPAVAFLKSKVAFLGVTYGKIENQNASMRPTSIQVKPCGFRVALIHLQGEYASDTTAKTATNIAINLDMVKDFILLSRCCRQQEGIRNP